MDKKKSNSDALDLISRLQKNQLTGEALSPHQRKVIVKYFYEEDSSWSKGAIAQLIGVTSHQVGKIKSALKRIGMWEVESIDVMVIGVDVLRKKNECQRKAADKGDWALVWRIEMEYVEKMQGLGFIYKAPEKHLVGSVMLDAESKMFDYFKERGVPNVDEFIRQLSGPNGNGDGDVIDAVPVLAIPSTGEGGAKVGD
jgi:hypothetical protein